LDFIEWNHEGTKVLGLKVFENEHTNTTELTFRLLDKKNCDLYPPQEFKLDE
jgi:hypothetical protein